MDDYQLPLPGRQPESDFYWDKAQDHELWLRRCNACQRNYFYPRDLCPDCYSNDVTWIQSSGRGTLHAFSVVMRGPTLAFSDSVPYIAALVDLDDGPRIPTNLVHPDPENGTIYIGMTVEVIFDDVTGDVTLPKFKPAS